LLNKKWLSVIKLKAIFLAKSQKKVKSL